MFNNLLTIGDYIDAARDKSVLDSDNKLNAVLLNKGPSVSTWRTGKSLPTPDKMAELARLGGNDQREALLRLDIWVAEKKNQPHAVEIYRNILFTLQHAAAVLAVAFLFTFAAPTTDANASGTLPSASITNIHYAIFRCSGRGVMW